MFKIMRKKDKEADSVKLEKIKKVLFPPPKIVEKDGAKIHVDYSPDWNLEGALADLTNGDNDEIVHSTIRNVITQLGVARRILEAESELDADVQYFVVDNTLDTVGVEDRVEAADEPL